MSKKTLLPLTFSLVLLLAMSIGANARGTPAVDLMKANWSVNAAHNLASNPPSLDAVQDFYDRAMGDDAAVVNVCEFRLADLRNSGNLSLIVSLAPGSWGCTELDIFDKTPTGFELYFAEVADGPVAHDLAHSVLDLNHDGRHELVLWGRLARFATSSRFHYGLGCSAEWPLIFVWTCSTYSDVSEQYKDYYRGYLNSVNTRLAAYSSVLAPATVQTANPMPVAGSDIIAGRHVELSAGPGGEGPRLEGGPIRVTRAPAPEGATPAWAARNEADLNLPCTRIEAAKTEAFLSIASDSTMNAAIKDSESDDPKKRIAAAVVFPTCGPRKQSRI